MINYLEVKVVTKDPSDIRIFQNGKLTNLTNFLEFMDELGKKNWQLVSSHAYMRNVYLYEKYYFMQK